MTEIKTRPALVKALAAAGITEYDISGRGASLSCRVWGRRNAVLFRRRVAKWSSIDNGSNTNFEKNPPYRPGSEFDFNDKASHHHY
ncbi:MAG: hypothetical protein EOP83_04415 [Verrucomicrobiaceae bacterium]|nr:MAG: hypothetical protein EOP83_04415 [Verrucomicrobiaceae bacterium]